MSTEGRSSKSDFKYCSVAEGKSKILFGRILSRRSSPKQPKYLDPCFAFQTTFACTQDASLLTSLVTTVEDEPLNSLEALLLLLSSYKNDGHRPFYIRAVSQ